MPQAPALFIGHGSPMNAIIESPASRGWAEIATRFDTPAAIAIVSAHWVTDGVRVGANARPHTIHDFGGFPQTLRDVRYPSPGDARLATRIADTLRSYDARADEHRGLDHGVWSVLKWMYPNADVPVIPVSLDRRRGPTDHFAIGKSLATLRDDNVLILATGNIVHNLAAFFRTKTMEPWITRFDDFIVQSATNSDDGEILNYADHPDAQDAAPDWDHFFPVFYAIGARLPGEQAHVFNQYYEPGISMTSFAYGLAPTDLQK